MRQVSPFTLPAYAYELSVPQDHTTYIHAVRQVIVAGLKYQGYIAHMDVKSLNNYFNCQAFDCLNFQHMLINESDV
jgi:hypothetical protein